ncbi:glutamate racemase [Paludibacter jiangxiensis]|uniref:Glutamate racemase n=1 Tax=Paludibacter jiangxiensis TaxID=681398 RepID=A0A161LFT3_9BACT|nr:glutamate racemase [Paludibacter jiangxiensis]GAT64065.1 glutamate racemase [Paludibacter jiangxiensis]
MSQTELSHKGIGPIGVFDSGYGGLTILNAIRQRLPQYDYLYLGDNARTPYGTRSFEVVYHYTLECVKKLFELDCHLVILACNTASAKALRSIQQRDLPGLAPNRRVLGVIRPTVEAIGSLTETRHVGLVGTTGTIQSQSYPLEIAKLFPDIVVTGEACPMWVPLVENGEYDSDGADYFVKKNLDHLFSVDPAIDTLILGCTHYPLLVNKIQKYLPKHVALVIQGDIVADSLADYLSRHPEMEQKCSQGGKCRFLTTEAEEKFAASASVFMAENINARQIQL